MYDELFAMADMYANTSTRQQEKYTEWQRTYGFTWKWEDCMAALDLLKEELGVIGYFNAAREWRKSNKCSTCNFPAPFHTRICRGDFSGLE